MIKPLNGRAVVRVEEAKEQTVSGIVLPSAAKEKQQVGVVEAVAENTEGFTSQLKEGDRVLFEKYAGSTFEYDGQELLIIKESDIIAIVD